MEKNLFFTPRKIDASHRIDGELNLQSITQRFRKEEKEENSTDLVSRLGVTRELEIRRLLLESHIKKVREPVAEMVVLILAHPILAP